MPRNTRICGGSLLGHRNISFCVTLGATVVITGSRKADFFRDDNLGAADILDRLNMLDRKISSSLAVVYMFPIRVDSWEHEIAYVPEVCLCVTLPLLRRSDGLRCFRRTVAIAVFTWSKV